MANTIVITIKLKDSEIINVAKDDRNRLVYTMLNQVWFVSTKWTKDGTKFYACCEVDKRHADAVIKSLTSQQREFYTA